MTTDTTEAGPQTRVDAQTPPPLAQPVRAQRRYRFIALGAALIALSGLAAYWLFTATADTVPVVAVAADVSRGETIDREDVTTVDAAENTAVETVPAENLEQLVGSRAAADLLTGSLLNPAAVSDAISPAVGESLVGVALLPNQLPAEALVPGDPVRVVDTPNPGDPPPDDSPGSVAATVLSVSGVTDTGHTVVDVLLDADQAGDLAARVATGRVALVLDSRERESE